MHSFRPPIQDLICICTCDFMRHAMPDSYCTQTLDSLPPRLPIQRPETPIFRVHQMAAMWLHHRNVSAKYMTTSVVNAITLLDTSRHVNSLSPPIEAIRYFVTTKGWLNCSMSAVVIGASLPYKVVKNGWNLQTMPFIHLITPQVLGPPTSTAHVPL